jgi:hypothetical protein
MDQLIRAPGSESRYLFTPSAAEGVKMAKYLSGVGAAQQAQGPATPFLSLLIEEQRENPRPPMAFAKIEGQLTFSNL